MGWPHTHVGCGRGSGIGDKEGGRRGKEGDEEGASKSSLYKFVLGH